MHGGMDSTQDDFDPPTLSISASILYDSALSQILRARPDFVVLRHYAIDVCYVSAFWTHGGEGFSTSRVLSYADARNARELLAEDAFERISEGVG